MESHCFIHANAVSQYYCHDCDQLLCRLCARLSSHRLIPISTYQSILMHLSTDTNMEIMQSPNYVKAFNLLPPTLDEQNKHVILQRIKAHIASNLGIQNSPNINMQMQIIINNQQTIISNLTNEVGLLKSDVNELKAEYKKLKDSRIIIYGDSTIQCLKNIFDKFTLMIGTLTEQIKIICKDKINQYWCFTQLLNSTISSLLIKKILPSTPLSSNDLIVMYINELDVYARSHNNLVIESQLKNDLLSKFKKGFFELVKQQKAIRIIESFSESFAIGFISLNKPIYVDNELKMESVKAQIKDYTLKYSEMDVPEEFIELVAANTVKTYYDMLLNHKAMHLIEESLKSVIIGFIKQDAQLKACIQSVNGDLIAHFNKYVKQLSKIMPMNVEITKMLNDMFQNKFIEIADKLNIHGFTVMQYRYLEYFDKWIGGIGSIGPHNIQYTQIFRASKNGYTNENFHSKCSNKGPTLLILKNNYNKIIGGYTPLSWDQSRMPKKDDLLKTFLFSMTLNKNYKLNPNKKSEAIFCSKGAKGACFGNQQGLVICNSSVGCQVVDSCQYRIENSDHFEPENYMQFVGFDKSTFSVEDYEVFTTTY